MVALRTAPGMGVQDEAPLLLNVIKGQGRQGAVPPSALYVPTGHGRQDVDVVLELAP